MELIRDLDPWRQVRASLSGVVGFVPTMGALHQGHASLLARARRECDITVMSLFVNPTQFDQPEDLANYPSTWDEDMALAEAHGVDYVLAPSQSALYPDDYRYQVHETLRSQELCGRHRPGHFDGVLTVVFKLLHLVRPGRAYFGEKDFQQLELVKGMVDAFFIESEVIPCPTVREPDGLAMSSRNRRLSAEGRRRAPLFPELLRSPLSVETIRENLVQAGFLVDYVVQERGRRFGAVHLEGVRLIDNVPV